MTNIGDKLISKAVKMSPSTDNVKKFTINKSGRIRLQITGESFFGKDQKLFNQVCKDQSFSNLPVSCVDVIGLIIAKKFFQFFLEYISKMDENDYTGKLIPFNHVHFTVQMCDTDIEITFHVSLLHNMMLENLNIY